MARKTTRPRRPADGLPCERATTYIPRAAVDADERAVQQAEEGLLEDQPSPSPVPQLAEGQAAERDRERLAAGVARLAGQDGEEDGQDDEPVDRALEEAGLSGGPRARGGGEGGAWAAAEGAERLEAGATGEKTGRGGEDAGPERRRPDLEADRVGGVALAHPRRRLRDEQGEDGGEQEAEGEEAGESPAARPREADGERGQGRAGHAEAEEQRGRDVVGQGAEGEAPREEAAQ